MHVGLVHLDLRQQDLVQRDLVSQHTTCQNNTFFSSKQSKQISKEVTYSFVILQPLRVQMEYPFDTRSSAMATAKVDPAIAKVVLKVIKQNNKINVPSVVLVRIELVFLCLDRCGSMAEVGNVHT